MKEIDRRALVARFMEYVQIDSETGDEGEMARRLAEDCRALGFEVSTDDVAQAARTTGCNVYVILPGDPALEPILFSAHLDTVVPGRGVKPQICDDGYIRSDGTTVLGGDDKAGICAILEAMKAARALPHRRVEAVFTVREESGLLGAKNLDYTRLQAKWGVVLDSTGGPEQIITSAPGQNEILARVTGRAAHAGIAPEEGISAIQAAAHAVANMKLLRLDEETTCNVGTFRAEGPANVVAPLVELEFEVRSRSAEKLEKQTRHVISCLAQACEKFGAELEYELSPWYKAYSLPPEHPLVRWLWDAAQSLGLEPRLCASGGGSDANVLNAEAIQAAVIGIGMERVHTNQEQLCIRQMEQAAQLCLEMMTQ